MSDIVTQEEKIAAKIDVGVAGALAVSNNAGGISFANAGQVMEFAKMLAISNVAVPKHLRGNPGACLGIVMQAVEWRMSPFAVANKSYSVNDRLAYEAQLIHAVVLQRAPINGRIKFDFLGEGTARSCRAWVQIKDSDEIVEYRSPRIADIKVKNSPLWAADPDQQLGYYSVRALCRRHFPDVLMGVYSKDELDDAPRIGPEGAKDVTPQISLAEKLKTFANSRINDVTGIEETVPAHDAETGEITGEDPDQEPGVAMPAPKRGRPPNKPKESPEPPEIEQLDTETAAILLSGKLAARNGQAEFTKWWRRLSAPEADRAEPYLEELHTILKNGEAEQ